MPDADPGPWSGCEAYRAPLERRLREAVHNSCGMLAAPLSRIVLAPGKRLRPALTLTFATRLTPRPLAIAERRRALELAASVELLHGATLVHDDLIDGARLRRGEPTVSAAEGVAAAVIGGDLLIAAATSIAARADAGAGLLISETLQQLARGEALQNSLRFDPTARADLLLEVIRDKSGSLLRAACELGALCAGADDDLRAVVGEFGEEFGIVLQLVDDLLDIVSTPALAGKPVDADFESGVLTLPASIAMAQHPELAAVFTPDADRLSRARSTALLRSGDAVRAGVELAAEHAHRAGALLAPACGRYPQLHELATRPAHYLWVELGNRIDPALAHLLPVRPGA